MRIVPPPSVAWATGTIPAATAEAAPPEEPPALIFRFHGLRVWPQSSDSVVVVKPNSGLVVLPNGTAPAVS
ncbi:hypothetical protein D9M73_206060 [compost metagenome]